MSIQCTKSQANNITMFQLPKSVLSSKNKLCFRSHIEFPQNNAQTLMIAKLCLVSEAREVVGNHLDELRGSPLIRMLSFELLQ